MPIYVPTPTPIGFFVNLTKKDSLIGSLYSKYQSPALEALRESLFGDGAVKYINLSTKEEEIAISLGNRSIPKSPLLASPSTKRVYINLIIKDLEATTYF
jgi:hypothetical protein